MSAAGRALILLLLCGFGFAQSPPATSVRTDPATGSVSAGVYTNNFFRLSYHIPSQWTLQGSANLFQTRSDYREETSAPDMRDSDGKKYLLMSAGETGTDNSVQVDAYDISEQSAMTANDVAVAELGALCSLGGKMQGVEKQTIAGRVFSIGRAEISGDAGARNRPVYVGVAAVKEGNFILTWSFFAASEAGLQQTLGTLDSINFDKEPSGTTE